MVDFEEIISNPGFVILNLVGFGALIMMLMVLKGMGNSDIMPVWVKIVAFISVPIVSAIFTAVMGE
jgi:hypothetical protein